jgi:hypothetical protein
MGAQPVFFLLSGGPYQFGQVAQRTTYPYRNSDIIARAPLLTFDRLSYGPGMSLDHAIVFLFVVVAALLAATAGYWHSGSSVISPPDGRGYNGPNVLDGSETLARPRIV